MTEAHGVKCAILWRDLSFIIFCLFSRKNSNYSSSPTVIQHLRDPDFAVFFCGREFSRRMYDLLSLLLPPVLLLLRFFISNLSNRDSCSHCRRHNVPTMRTRVPVLIVVAIMFRPFRTWKGIFFSCDFQPTYS